MRRLGGWLAILALACAGVTSRAEGPPPNVVLLLADDLGYGDLGVTGHPYARSTAIDRLAAEGTLFRRFYVAGATCCPSRTGLMTGRFPAAFRDYPASYGLGDAPTVTALLKAKGYRTGHVGKWHLGPEQSPGTYGIDVIKEMGGNRRDPRGRDADIADAAIDFLRENKDGPFYLNVWLRSTHNPVRPPRPLVEPFRDLALKRADFTNPDMQAHFDLYAKLGGDPEAGMRAYLGEVAGLDRQVGRVLAAIDELGLRGRTLVAFTSDNGPANCTGGDDGEGDKEKGLKENMLGSAGPFRARKHSLYDGGIHQPLIVRLPGAVPAGRVDESSVVAGVDWMPSVVALAGGKAPAADGEDASGLWLGASRPRSGDLYWKASNPGSAPAMLRGDWKVHLPRKAAPELYDLAKDPGEREDVAARHPEVARDLVAALRRWNASLPIAYRKGARDDD